MLCRAQQHNSALGDHSNPSKSCMNGAMSNIGINQCPFMFWQGGAAGRGWGGGDDTYGRWLRCRCAYSGVDGA